MPEQGQRADLTKFWRMFKRRKWWGVSAFLIVAVLVGGMALVLPPKYRARCVLSVGKAEAFEAFESGRVYGPAPTARELVPLARNSMLEYNQALVVIQGAGLDRDIPRDDPIALEELHMDLSEDLQVAAIGLDLIEVSYAHPDPNSSQFVVRELVSNLLESTLKHDREQARRTVNFILEKKDQLEAELDEADIRLKEFREQNATRLPNMEFNKRQQLDRAEEQLNELELKIATQGQILEKVDVALKDEEEMEVSMLREMRDPALELLRQQIVSTEAIIKRLEKKFREKMPELMTARATLAALEATLEEKEREIVKEEEKERNPRYAALDGQRFSLSLDIAALEQERRYMATRADQLQKDVDSMPDIIQQLSKLERNYESYGTQYQERLKQLAEAQLKYELSLTEGASMFNIVVPARASSITEKETLIKVLGGGFALAIGLAVGLIFAMEYMDQSFMDVDDVRQLLRIPSLGVVPQIVTKEEARRKRLRTVVVAVAIVVVLAGIATACILDPKLNEFVKNMYEKAARFINRAL